MGRRSLYPAKTARDEEMESIVDGLFLQTRPPSTGNVCRGEDVRCHDALLVSQCGPAVRESDAESSPADRSLTPKLLPDTAGAPRGVGFKVFGVEGDKIFQNPDQQTQDWTFNNYPLRKS